MLKIEETKIPDKNQDYLDLDEIDLGVLDDIDDVKGKFS